MNKPVQGGHAAPKAHKRDPPFSSQGRPPSSGLGLLTTRVRVRVSVRVRVKTRSNSRVIPSPVHEVGV